MKRRIVCGLILIVLAAAGAYFLWPHSFSQIAPDCTSITVRYIESSLEHDSETKVYEQGTAGFEKIQGVLADYTYHRSLRTLSGDSSLEGNHAGYWLHLYLDSGDDRKVLICGGTGQISMDGRVYRVGYWGDGRSLSFMGQIMDIFHAYTE